MYLLWSGERCPSQSIHFQDLLLQEDLPFAHQVAKYPVLKAPRHVPTFAEQKEVSPCSSMPVCRSG